MSFAGDRFRSLIGPHGGTLALLAALGLSGMGVAAIGTTEHFSSSNLAQWQAIWLLLSMGAMVLCTLPHPRTLSLLSYPLLGISLLLLVLLLIPAVPTWLVEPRNGARSWINFQFMLFQPSELAKIACVLALARYLRFREQHRTLPGLLPPFLMTAVPVALIFVEPDLGMTLLFPPMLFAVLIAAGAKLRHIISLLSLGAIALTLVTSAAYFRPDLARIVLKPHQIDRIRTMISYSQGDTRQNKDKAYQQDKAITLISAGRLAGYGAQGAATVIHYNDLPEAHNDMIFPVIVNRWGLAGGLGALGLYATLLGSFTWSAGRTKDPFARLAIVGFTALLFTQMTINIGMTLGLLPITGLTLPLVSYGGSSLLTTYMMLGLVINFASRRHVWGARASFEFDQADAVLQ